MSTFNPVGGIVWAAPTATDNFNWIAIISAGLTALGLPIDGTVSGQINLGTGSIAIPGSITTNTIYPMGYEIRTMASSGLTTLKVRIDYKLNSTSTTAASLYPVVVITVGTTVNTSTGVVGGAVTTAGASTPNNTSINTGNASMTARQLFMSSDGANYLTMTIDPGRAVVVPATVCACTVLERSLTAATGAYNNNGYQLISLTSPINSSASDGAGCWNVNLASSVCTYSNSFGTTFPGSMWTSSGAGKAATVSPVSVMLPDAQGPMLSAIGYYNSDINGGVSFVAQIYGANHTFMPCGVTYFSFSQSPTTGGTLTALGAQRMAMRYE